jgi:hypothetical protein
MSRPSERHEQPHQERRGDREASVIKQPDGNEAEDQWMSSAPEPKVLMQNVERGDGKDEQGAFHMTFE